MDLSRLLIVCALISLGGCATTVPTSRPVEDRQSPVVPEATGEPSDQTIPGAQIAAQARSLVGSPYRYGGTSPDGFDCSGLVFFVHRQAGIAVPRTAATQFGAARRVATTDLVPGDVVFFHSGGRDITHVGVYVGSGEFVHAPKSGRPVSYARLGDDYYAVNFAGAGRLH